MKLRWLVPFELSWWACSNGQDKTFEDWVIYSCIAELLTLYEEDVKKYVCYFLLLQPRLSDFQSPSNVKHSTNGFFCPFYTNIRCDHKKVNELKRFLFAVYIVEFWFGQNKSSQLLLLPFFKHSLKFKHKVTYIHKKSCNSFFTDWRLVDTIWRGCQEIYLLPLASSSSSTRFSVAIECQTFNGPFYANIGMDDKKSEWIAIEVFSIWHLCIGDFFGGTK